MDPQAFGFVATGLLIGAISGILGIGGAVILVPTLVLVFGYSQAKAQGTSLGALVPPIGIFAALQYYRQGLLDVRAAALIAGGFVFGALGGAAVVSHIPQVWLKRAFATVLVYVAGQLVFADPNRKLGSVLPSVAAAASLWLIYGINRLLRRKPIAEVKSKPSDEDIDFHI
ncbi:MAG: sulfite exporter TauE/SafE family protein [Myxococcales bacterium]|nr:sulfite exporter TauE/SafE family protein [Myxococcales bacterium]